MPKNKPTDRGRGFDVYEAIGWEQRVEKEEQALFLHDVEREEKRRRREREKRQRRRLDSRLTKLEKDAGLSQYSSTMNNFMYQTNALPADVRAMQRWPVTDSCLMTMRPRVKKEEGLVPKLTFSEQVVDAMWMPGGKMVVRKPEFYLEPEPDPDTIRKPWRLPPAGRPAYPVQGGGVTADAAADEASSLLGCSRGSTMVATRDHLSSTQGSMRRTQQHRSAPSLHGSFDGCASNPAARSTGMSSSGRRRVNSLALAGGSSLPPVKRGG